MSCTYEGQAALIVRPLPVAPLYLAPPESHILSRHIDQHRGIRGEGSRGLVIVASTMPMSDNAICRALRLKRASHIGGMACL